LLTGEIGCGKTMVTRMLQTRLRGTTCQTILLENAWGDFSELMRDILAMMNGSRGSNMRFTRRIERSESRYDLIHRFQDFLHNRILRLHRHLVIILDEAQQISESALVDLKNLTNLSSGGENALSIILSGQPELSDMIRALPAIDQRIGLRYHLGPLQEEEVGQYVDARTQAAGYSKGSLFTAKAKAALFAETSGIPREINRVCKLALDKGFSQGVQQVDEAIVTNIAIDVFQQAPGL